MDTLFSVPMSISFTCPICEHGSTSARGILLHLRRVHSWSLEQRRSSKFQPIFNAFRREKRRAGVRTHALPPVGEEERRCVQYPPKQGRLDQFQGRLCHKVRALTGLSYHLSQHGIMPIETRAWWSGRVGDRLRQGTLRSRATWFRQVANLRSARSLPWTPAGEEIHRVYYSILEHPKP